MLCCTCLWIVHSWLHLRLYVSLNSPLLITPSVVRVSEQSILDYTFGCTCLWTIHSWLHLRLHVSLNSPFLITPSVVRVSEQSILDYTFGCTCLWIVHSWLHLRLHVSLNNPFLITPSVFSNVYFYFVPFQNICFSFCLSLFGNQIMLKKNSVHDGLHTWCYCWNTATRFKKKGEGHFSSKYIG